MSALLRRLEAVSGADGAVHARVSVVTVIHNSAATLPSMLASIPADVEVVVVDNRSTDGGAAISRRARADVVVVEAPENRGFGAGCNLGAGVASGDVLAFVNPDVILEQSTLRSLTAAVGHSPGTVAGPALLDEDGNLRSSLRRPSRPWHEFLGLLPSSERWQRGALRQELPVTDPRYTGGGSVSYLQGACLVMRRETFDEAGGFDERFFLYSEEEDLCDRIWRQGGQCLYVPTAVARHIGGTSTAKIGAGQPYHHFRSRALFYEKKYGPVVGLLTRTAIRLALLCGVLTQRANVRLGRKCSVPRGWHRAAWRGVSEAGTGHRGESA